MSATAALMKSKKGTTKPAVKKDDPEVKDAKKHGAKGKADGEDQAIPHGAGAGAHSGKGGPNPKKGTSVVKVKPEPKQEILPPDDLSKAATEIENLKSGEKANELAHTLYDGVEFDLFRLGGVLLVIQDKGWHEPYASFREYVEADFEGLKYRKALYLIEIYNSLLAAGIEWEAVKKVGWTKLKEIAPILTTNNVDKWVKKAIKLKTIQLIEEVRQAKKGTADKGKDEGVEVTKLSTKTFKLHADQRAVIDEALEKARLEVDTQYDSVAIEQVCLSYLSGPKAKKGSAMPEAVDLFKHILAKYSKSKNPREDALAEVFTAFDQVFENVDVALTIN